MKTGIGVTAVLLVLVLGVLPVAAQQSQPSPGRPPMPGGMQEMPGGAPQGMPGGMMGGQHMGGMMMCPMMLGMMGAQADPRMMQMHGEMMKAIGDVMLKYGKMMEGGTR
jgi:hypothetical protein